MGTQEKILKSKLRRTKVHKSILFVVGAAGLLSVALVAPNALAHLGRVRFLGQRKYQITNSLTRMVKLGYLSFVSKGGTRYVQLTPKGEVFLASSVGNSGALTRRRKKWDGKWRVVIFDIPERKKSARRQLRATLMTLGFRLLQDSVWVYPYDCEDLLTLIKADYAVGKDVLYIIADSIENDRALRKEFNLN